MGPEPGQCNGMRMLDLWMSRSTRVLEASLPLISTSYTSGGAEEAILPQHPCSSSTEEKRQMKEDKLIKKGDKDLIIEEGRFSKCKRDEDSIWPGLAPGFDSFLVGHSA